MSAISASSATSASSTGTCRGTARKVEAREAKATPGKVAKEDLEKDIKVELQVVMGIGKDLEKEISAEKVKEKHLDIKGHASSAEGKAIKLQNVGRLTRSMA